MIIYKKGDVLNSGESVVVHGCNCFKTMGAGIARQVREQCPNAYKADQDTLWGDRKKLGSSTLAYDNGMLIINAYTQYEYARDRVVVDYDALRSAMEEICQTTPGEDVIAMPKIGCGLGGGDWKIVSQILEEVSEEYNKTFHVYEL